MLLRAVQDWGIDVSRSFMVGDKPRDIEAGRAAGANSFLVCGGKADHPRRSLGALSMIQAARIILEQAAL
jgi:D-glycero-D-manno-heptose 1,7-bisphosphate phosphatase